MSHTGRPGPPDITDTYSLLVLNINFRTKADDLFPLFDKYGDVVDIHIPRDRRTGESRGFAFVRYKHGDEAQEAVDRLDGKVFDGREIAVQFAKYGPNAERIQKGRILEPIAKVRSPRPRYRDDYRDRDYRRRSRSRSLDRYGRDRYRERDGSYRRRSRSRSYSPGYSKGRGRDRYDDDDRSYGSRSPKSASPPRRSRSSRRTISPRRVSPRRTSLSKSSTPDRRSHKVPSVSPRRSVSPCLGSPRGGADGSRSPSPH